MGATGVIVKWFGKTLGESVKVPVKDGIMFPYVYKYEDKVRDLAHETNKVSLDFVKSIVEEAYRRHDMVALKVCYDYMINVYKMSPGAGFIFHIVRYGQDIITRAHIGNPFALVDIVEKAVNALC